MDLPDRSAGPPNHVRVIGVEHQPAADPNLIRGSDPWPERRPIPRMILPDSGSRLDDDRFRDRPIRLLRQVNVPVNLGRLIGMQVSAVRVFLALDVYRVREVADDGQG